MDNLKRITDLVLKKPTIETHKNELVQPKRHLRSGILSSLSLTLSGSSSSSNNNSNNNTHNSNNISGGSTTNSSSSNSNNISSSSSPKEQDRKPQKPIDKKQKELSKFEKLFAKGKRTREELQRKQELKEQVKRISGAQLAQAAADGDVAQVEEILQRDRRVVNDADDTGQTALHVASQYGHLQVVRALLRYKADCYLQDSRGWTALHCAAFENREDVMLELCRQRHIDFCATNEDDNTPLHYFARTPYSSAKVDILKAFLSGGADINAKNTFQETPLHQAVWKENAGMAVLLIENGANPRIPNGKGDTPYDLLYVLSNKELTDRVEAAIKAREAPMFRMPTSPSLSATLSAPVSIAGSANAATASSPSAAPAGPLKPVVLAPTTPRVEDGTTSNFSSENVQSSMTSSSAPSVTAAASATVTSSTTSPTTTTSWSLGKISRKLLNLSPSQSPSPGVTIGSNDRSGGGGGNGGGGGGCAKQTGSSPLTQQLKAPVLPKQIQLSIAASSAKNGGEDSNSSGERMKIEFFMDAVCNGRVEEVRALLKLDRRLADCVSGPSKNTPLHVAALLGNVAVVKLLLGTVTKAARNGGGWTPLMAALWRGHEAAALAILTSSLYVDVAARLRDGNTAMHFAARNAGPLVEFVLNALLERGALLDSENGEGDTPLHCAVVGNQLDLIRLLVARGANKGKANKRGETPLTIAQKNSFTEIISFLS